jgi:hypothetical protein
MSDPGRVARGEDQKRGSSQFFRLKGVQFSGARRTFSGRTPVGIARCTRKGLRAAAIRWSAARAHRRAMARRERTKQPAGRQRPLSICLGDFSPALWRFSESRGR